MSNAVCYAEIGVISPTLHISSMIAMLWLIYQYTCKSMKSEQNKTLKNLGFTLFSIQMMYCMVTGSNSLIWAFTANCSMELGIEFLKKYVAVAVMLFISTILYSAQYAVMIFLLFYRLKFVFDGTAYELSLCTKWTFYIMYVLLILLTVSSFSALIYFLSGGQSFIGIILVSFAGLSAILIIFFLTFLFVTKLIDVNKRCDGHRESKLLSTITKQSILTLISIVSLLACVIIFFLLSWTRLLVSSIDAHFVFILYSLIDIWTNFICILVSYHCFNAFYTKMCGCCDIKCKQLCGKLAKPQKHQKIWGENIESSSGHSVQSTSVEFE